MNIIKVCFVLATIFGLSACSDVKSTEWYSKHPEEASQKLLDCIVDASANDDEGCQNALEAQVPGIKALNDELKSAVEK